jgi:hypothetical protein
MYTVATIGTTVKLAEREFNEYIEKYAAAFLKETGLKASECVLIQKQSLDSFGYEYEVRKKEEAPNKRV